MIKKNKIIREEIVTSTIEGSYQEKLKECITEICYRMDISKPYWLPKNMNEYNRRTKTSFNKDNFIEELDFDKFQIEELKDDLK
nr:hypothetical protein [Clostridium aestuarii]